MTQELLIKSFLLTLLFFSAIFILRNLFVRYTFLNKYKIYLELFKYFTEESFQMIYKDQISGYAVNGHTIQGDALETAKRNYIKLCFQLMGTMNEKNLSDFYGGRKNLITNMLIYFQNKIDDDEIVKILSEKEMIKD